MRCIERILMVLFLAGTAACGPVIQLIDVDVKLPAEYPLTFDNGNIGVFNALYDTSGVMGMGWNDSLLINKVAEGFRDRLAEERSLDRNDIPIYNHFCGQTPGGALGDKEYIYSLSEQTGCRSLVLIDSLRFGDFERVHTRTALSTDGYNFIYVSNPWQMVFRFFDMDQDRFTAFFAIRDTLYWNIYARERDTLLIDTKVHASLPEAASFMGAAVAKLTHSQWETQERVLFSFGGGKWYKALDHAFMFEWEDAQAIWLALTQKTKNGRKVAYAAFNLAVASEMLGRMDLAKEWLELSKSYVDIPEITHYLQMLEERKQQQRNIILHLED
ncbi:MAG: DUF6340 family protein [Bacteroidetes bacterium]|nr:DUF6340 family protein [Bacteroidota bacterium]